MLLSLPQKEDPIAPKVPDGLLWGCKDTQKKSFNKCYFLIPQEIAVKFVKFSGTAARKVHAET